MIRIQRSPIDVEAVIDSVRRDDAGAIAMFLGTVRAEPDVDALDYEVYKPMAIRTFADLVDVAKAKFGVIAMSIVHRVGRVSVGSDSVAIACAAVHRAEAFSACAWAMDEVKRVVPIWKQETGPRTPRAGRRRSSARRKTR